MDPHLGADVADDDIAFRAQPHHVHRTWARTFASRPELFIQPESLPEIEKLLSLARRRRRRVVVTGCGHSPSHLTCTSSWLVNLDRFNRILSLDRRSGIVVMESGIRLFELCAELDRYGLAMPNLGSINDQSITGAICTGTHGSSTRHGLLSENVVALQITLADGTTRSCSPDENPDLFRAALLSLGALGIITQITLRAVPAFKLRWNQTIDTDRKVLNSWSDDLWTRSEFIRVWWLPHTRRAVIWRADRTDEPVADPPTSYFDGQLGYTIYHNLLYIAHWIPSFLPWVEWFVFGMQHGFRNGSSLSAVQPSAKALLLNCLYSQHVNEWALPLAKGPEVLRRLSTWINHLDPSDPDYMPHNIPFSADGLYVHSPVEVRVSDTTVSSSPRPYLDPTCSDGPTLYLNAIVYRPYFKDSPNLDRYYQGFEYLMRELGGRPHWAKNFNATRPEIEAMYGKDLDEYRRVRDEVDPEGMFVGPWHRELIMQDGPVLPLEEVETSRQKSPDGILTVGKVSS